MKNDYILSIVIPTKNRQTYLIKCVEQIEEIVDDRVQVVIQDNSDDNSLEECNLLNKYANIKYDYSAEKLSFVSNFNKAVENAEGNYICIIGDDDGVTRNIIDVVEWAMKNNVDSVTPSILFEYFWPDSFKFGKYKKNNGIVRILKKNLSAQKYDSCDGVIRLLKNGCQDYMYYDMVKLYHGIVKRERLEDIKKITGKYFGGLSPDIYISTALSLICKNNYKIMYPLTIAGVCKGSGSANSSSGKHIGKYEDAPHLIGHNHYSWSKYVPRFYSVETIWADSALAAIKDMGYLELEKKFNISMLVAQCRIKHGDYEKYMNETEKMHVCRGKVFKEKIWYYIQKVKHRVDRMGDCLIIENNFADINEAYKFFEEKYNCNKDVSNKLIEVLEKAI